MLAPTSNADNRTLLLSNDADTPWDVVVGMLRNVFALQPEEAEAMTRKVHSDGFAKIGPYPTRVAEALLAAAVEVTGPHKLQIRILGDNDELQRCAFCENTMDAGQRRYSQRKAAICHNCLAAGLAQFQSEDGARPNFGHAFEALVD